MGLALMVAVGLALIAPVRSLLRDEPGQRAGTLAEELAHTIVDYRQETGVWPRSGASGLELSVLAGRPVRIQAADAVAGPMPTVAADGPLVAEIPLDPWRRSFRAYLAEDGRGVAVVSAGPDGRFDTAPDDLAKMRAERLVFRGDDTGYILLLDNDGEGR